MGGMKWITPPFPPLSLLSSTQGFGFSIKESPQDFAVEEMASLPEFGGGNYCYFMLEKEGKTTQEALEAVANALSIPAKSIWCAGQKDRQAKTIQAACAYGVGKEKLASARLPPSIRVNYLGHASRQLKIGMLLGNRFRIRAGGVEKEGTKKKVAEIAREISFCFPNYFGPQRFGQRGNTHTVGKFILQGRMQDAAECYLMECGGSENEAQCSARKRLKEEGDFGQALLHFPSSLAYERRMLEVLAREPNNYVKAFMALPRQTLLVFAHSCQSWLFNLELSRLVEEGRQNAEGDAGASICVFGTNSLGFPDENSKEGKKWVALNLIGWDSKINEMEKALLESNEMRLSDFKAGKMPFLSCKGGARSALCPLANFSFDGGWFSFELPPGAYATCALAEFGLKK